MQLKLENIITPYRESVNRDLDLDLESRKVHVLTVCLQHRLSTRAYSWLNSVNDNSIDIQQEKIARRFLGESDYELIELN